MEARLNGTEEQIAKQIELNRLIKEGVQSGMSEEDARDFAGSVMARRNSVEARSKTAGAGFREFANEAKQDLSDLSDEAYELAGSIQNSIGSAMSTAVQNVITGAGTAEEAMSQMFANVGAAFIDMATQMIAQALVLKALGVLLPGASGGDGTLPSNSFFNGGGLTDVFGLGSTGPKMFAEGGFVTEPTQAVVGEGGENEVIIPESKISAAMSNYKPGSGAAGLARAMNEPENGLLDNGATVVNYTGPTLNFDGTQYVPKSAIPEIIDAAAKRGAKEGKADTFRSLRNNRSQRAKVGL